MKGIFPMSKEIASLPRVFQAVKRVYEGDALVVETGDDNGMKVQVGWSWWHRDA